MQAGLRLLVAAAAWTSLEAHAQLGPSAAYPIEAASPPPPAMQFERKDRTVDVEVRVDADGHVLSTRLLTRSGNGVFDERVRGFWKHQPFVPALDANGQPVESTLHTRAVWTVRPPPGASRARRRRYGWRFRTEVLGSEPAAMISRIERMTCRDVLWEYDFMRRVAPRAKLENEEIFRVAFAMYIASKRIAGEARESLIAQSETLVDQTLDSCRLQPEAPYWRDAFAHTFESATPVGVNVR
jgi:hypothetical protein